MSERQPPVASPEIGKRLRTGAFETNYHDLGKGRAVLLIHGSGPGVTAWANWRQTLPALAGYGRVIAPDMVGFGYTESPSGISYNVETWVTQLVNLLDALRIDTVSIVGNSFGGSIALAFAKAHSQRVNKLVLMGAVGASFPITPGLEKVWGYQPSKAAMKELLQVFVYDQAMATDDLTELRYRASVRSDVQQRFASLFPSPRQRWVDTLALGADSLRRIEPETLVVHGRDDQVIPFSASERLAALLPHARLVPFDRCGHWVQIEHAKAFNELAAGFLFADESRRADLPAAALAGATGPNPLSKSDVVGRWRILRWEQRYDDGRVTHPLGTALDGYIQYDDDGAMCCIIRRSDRPPFVTGGQWNAADSEKARAYDGYLSYAGRYSILGDEIRHQVEHSLFPNWVGGTQVRRARFEAGELLLSARLEDGTSEARTANLAWARV